MSETRLTNAVIPDVFSAYTVEPSIYKSRFVASGAMVQDAGISQLLSGGGEIYNLPFWQDVSGTSGDIPSETVAATVNNLAALKQAFRKQVRNKVWGANDLVAVYSGDDPMGKLQNLVTGYWAQAFDQVAVASLRGVVADNIANDSGDIVNDISAVSGSGAYFSDAGVIDAQAKLGENGTIGAMDNNNGGFAAILVHPSTYAYMRKIDVIDFVPISGQERPLEFYMGMQVIVDRNAYVNSTVYDSYILKNGALRMGLTTSGYIPTEVYRDPTVGFGIDKLFTRRTFAIHPIGTAWTDTSVAGVSPSDAELYGATNWNRVFGAENMGLVVLRHKLG
jgi:hypothetical protein